MVFTTAGGGATQETGYEISNSLRFEANGHKLTRTYGTPTSQRIFTFSVWVKRSNFDSHNYLIGQNDTNEGYIRFTGPDGDRLNLEDRDSGSGSSDFSFQTSMLFRDPSAWYHVVIAFDTTQSTDTNRRKVYVNGVQQTDFSASTIAPQNYDMMLNQSGPFKIGATFGDLGAYLADFYFIDGQQKEASVFGEYNDNGVWIPKDPTDVKENVTFGNNGFLLEFKQTGTSANSSGMGADTSGNDNHWAATNLAAIDVTTDTPTNNFATLNPALNTALSEGNTKVVTTRLSNWDGVHSSIGVTSGKWYFEVKASLSDDSFRVGAGVAGNPETFPKIFNGLGDNGDPMNTFSNTYPFYGKGVWLEHWYDQNYNDSSTASTQSSGDILQFALDMDNYKLWVGVNGQFKDNSNNNVSYSDVASGNSPTVTIASAAYTGKTFFPGILIRDDQDADDNVAEINFGNPPFSISSGNSDVNGHGNFEYAVPSGYFALCTKNLANYG